MTEFTNGISSIEETIELTNSVSVVMTEFSYVKPELVIKFMNYQQDAYYRNTVEEAEITVEEAEQLIVMMQSFVEKYKSFKRPE